MTPRFHVLLVEDSAAYSAHMRRELIRADSTFDITHADRLEIAIAMLGESPFDVVLLDLNLSDSEGLETLHRVRAASDAPVVILTGAPDHSLATASLQAGAQDYLLKTEMRAPIVARVVRYAVERRAAEMRLRERDAIYRSIVESSLDAIIGMDHAGRVIEFNPAAETTFHRTRAEALGKDLADLIMPERMRGAHRLGLARHLATGHATVIDRRLELVGMRADGSEFPVELTILKLHTTPPTFTGFIRDLSERNNALSRLAEQASLLDHARDAILVRGMDHRISYFNKSAERMYGWVADDVMGQSVRERFFPDPAVFDNAMAELIQQGAWLGEMSVNGRDDARLTVESRWTLMRDGDGRPRAVLVIDTDITERKELERRVLRAQRMESIGTLAGGIAHDLNNVLAPVLMSIELLKDNPTEAERAMILETIEASTRRGADMVRQVLSFARGVEGERTAIDIARLLRDAEKIVKDTFMKAITVETAIAPALTPVLGDLTQLHQVVINLCVNARDAMPDGGVLTLAAQLEPLDARNVTLNPGAREGLYVAIRVTDTGTGISPRVMDRIFDPFFTSKPTGKGTGLGLSTSLAIVKSHGGFMRVDSEENRGSTFAVYLPAQAGLAVPAAGAAAPALARGAGELILVVDDEEPLLRMTSLVLESFGYRVLLAANGFEALALFGSNHEGIELVVTDMTMPVMDGSALIGRLREIDPHVRIIAASGLGATDARIAGARHFLPKPYNADTLLKAVTDALRG